MSAVDHAPTEAMREIAADWIARRQGGFAPGEEAKFIAWTNEDPRHGAAVREIEEVWGRFNAPRLAGEAGPILRSLARGPAPSRRRARLVWAAATLAAAAAIAFVIWPRAGRRPAEISSVVVRPNVEELPDGSRVELNAGAEIAVDYTPAERGVRLVKGEALFAVAKNSGRPFVVHVASVSVKAVGTSFRVRFNPEEVNVLVTEGRVAVERHESAAVPAAAPVYLNAGSQVVLPAAAQTIPVPEAVAPLDVAATLAWRNRRLEFTETPLAEAVALFNRQNRVQLALGASELGTRGITGIFWADDPESFARVLESILGLKSARAGNTIVLSRNGVVGN